MSQSVEVELGSLVKERMLFASYYILDGVDCGIQITSVCTSIRDEDVPLLVSIVV